MLRTPASFLIGLAVLLPACAAPTTDAEFVARDSAGLVIAENPAGLVTASCVVDSTPVVRIGGDVDNDDNFLYREMGVTRLSDGRIVVVNQGTQEVRWYSPEGELVGRAGRAGQGPGEFSSAFLIYQTLGDTVWVGDYRPWQWHIFGPEMEFVRTVRMVPNEVNSPEVSAVMSNGMQLFGISRLGQRANFEMDSTAVQLHGADGQILDTVMTLPTGRLGQTSDSPGSIWMRPWFEGFVQAEGMGDQFVVVKWGEPELTVYQVADALTPVAIIRWDAGDRQVTNEAVEAQRARLANQYPDLDPGRKAMLIDPMLDPSRPVAEQLPAVSRLLLGRDGRIWVRSFTPVDATTDSWLAFSPGGKALCRMSLPRLSVSEIGADYLVVTGEDSLGAEWVAEYRYRVEEGN